MIDETTPSWTVLYNIVSEGSDWVGTGWEFFNHKKDADVCYKKHNASGNCASMRPYHQNDIEHLGAAHRYPFSNK